MLDAAGVKNRLETSVASVLRSIDKVLAGGAIIAEEALDDKGVAAIEEWLERQPPWSDLPIILIARAGETHTIDKSLSDRLGNVTILPRPLNEVPLMAAARAALRARKRQHDAERYVEELEQSEIRLRESENRYRALFNTMDEGFCIIEFIDGPDGPLSDYLHVEANDAYARHAGITNVVGQKVQEVVPDEAGEWVRMFRSVLDSGEPIRFERELVATKRHLELAAFRIEPKEQKQVAVLFQDVTARRQAEIALQEINLTLEKRVAEAVAERNLLADLVEGTDAIVQVAAPDFRLLAINRAAIAEFERLHGVRPRVGDNKLDLIAAFPEHVETTRRIWERAFAGESFTEVIEQDDGEGMRAFEAKFAPLFGPDGTQIGAYQFAYDVTDRLQDQKRLAEATARMHEMAKLETLGQLTGGVAHDFNNLLTPIVGALDMLRRQHEGEERSNRLISGAMQAAERAATLVQRLLSFARRQHLEARTVDVKELVEGMQDLMQRTIGTHIKVDVETVPGLPPARIDPGQLELAVLNLAVNARDAMAGGGRLRIRLDETTLSQANDGLEPGRYIRLAVKDSGVGMDELTLKRAIEPFFTTKGQGEGTGLGLSMVHGLAAQSGGALRISSKVGKGTTAELWLPAANGDAEDLTYRDQGLPVQPRRATILLVDDEDLVRQATAEMLREMGHRVIEATSGRAALVQVIDNQDIDLLITDHLMPGIRGSELAEEVSRRRPGLPALLLTGYANLASGEATGIPRLSKPFREADLARQVASLLASETPAERRAELRSVD